MKNIYIIVGSTGRYDDYIEWNFCAYADKSAADFMCNNLNEKLKELGLYVANHDYYALNEKPKEIMKTFDPKFYCDYTGSSYEAVEVEFRS